MNRRVCDLQAGRTISWEGLHVQRKRETCYDMCMSSVWGGRERELGVGILVNTYHKMFVRDFESIDVEDWKILQWCGVWYNPSTKN